jgi:sphingomyelin phosphodiesterase acid-like 3
MYSTVTQHRNVCAGQEPVTFLAGDELGSTFAQYGDVIKLVLLGHTHMDEMRLYRSAAGDLVPGKLAPSLSPVNGNAPTFTLAWVNPRTAQLADYAVIVASNVTGLDEVWREEYRYSKTYDESVYSGASVDALMRRFASQPAGAASDAYAKFYSAGDLGLRAMALHMVWPEYVCSITHDAVADFRSCTCATPAASHP